MKLSRFLGSFGVRVKEMGDVAGLDVVVETDLEDREVTAVRFEYYVGRIVIETVELAANLGVAQLPLPL